MKGREVIEILRNRGMEQGTAHILTHLVEMQNQQAKDLKELAMYFDKMMGSMDGMLNVAGNMKSALESLNSEKPEVE